MNCPLNISFLSDDLWKVYLRWEGQMMTWGKSYIEFISALHVSSEKFPWSCRPREKRTVWLKKWPLPSCECLRFVGFLVFFSSLYFLPIQMSMLFIYFLYVFSLLIFCFSLCIQAVCFWNVLLGFRDPGAWFMESCRKAETNVLRFWQFFLYFQDILE